MILTRPAVGHVAAAEIAVRRGIRMLQLREKGLDDGELLRIAREVRAVTRGTDTRFIINDRPDIAVLCEADGVHVGQGDLDVADVRRITDTFSRPMIVGLSTHSIEQATQAQELITTPECPGVDYIGFGPVYATTTKAVADPVVGTRLLAEVLGFSKVPVVSIGGIFPENIDTVLQAGAKNPCMVRYFMEPDDPAEVERRVAAIQEKVGF